MRLRLSFLAGACLLCLVSPSPAAPEPSADSLMRDVVAQLPRESLAIAGDLTVRKRHGIVTRELRFEMLLKLGSEPAVAQYTIRDAFGLELERLTVTREGDRAARLLYAHGDPPVPAPVPSLSDLVQETDISWIDLTLSFLWWRGGSVAGMDEVLGYPCYIVDVPAPADGSPARAAQCVRMRLWIEKERHMLLQAEAHNAAGISLRRLWVRSLKKIDERWMIKELEVEGVPALHRTKLQVNTVTPLAVESGRRP